jgi:predicted AlkP superfamily phosphohydrolase/phosphomutase
VLGLDGASFDVLDPLIAAGKLPFLAELALAGQRGALQSTVPPMSFPAWSSFLTGLDPGEHGIFDFTQKRAGAYQLEFVNATHRSGESLLARASRAGRRVLCLGVPATFPPESVDGLVVAGFDAPVSSATDPRSASDPALYRAIAERAGPWKRPDLDESARDPRFHERAVETLLARIETKTAFACEALRQLAPGGAPDLAVVVFAESDTVAHHYWRDHDPSSPRHDPHASDARKQAITAVYERLDAACAELQRAFGDARCVVLSDHGCGGASRHVVHVNRRLADRGLLARKPALPLDRSARLARDLALRVLPSRVVQRLFRGVPGAAARVESAARFGGFDWNRTRAFSEEANTQPGVWINLRGRESAGCVAPEDYEPTRDAVIQALREWTLPDGAPVVAHAWRREEIVAGPFCARAPDVVFELALDAGYGLTLVPTPWAEGGASVRRLTDEELAGGRGRGMNGTHRPDGIWIAHDPAGRWAPPLPECLAQVAPLLLDGIGVPWEGASSSNDAAQGYTDEESALVEARLRALGYLE